MGGSVSSDYSAHVDSVAIIRIASPVLSTHLLPKTNGVFNRQTIQNHHHATTAKKMPTSTLLVARLQQMESWQC